MTRKYLAALTACLAVSACGDQTPASVENALYLEETPEVQAASEARRAACVDWPHPDQLDAPVRQGDLGAIDCDIAWEEWGFVKIPTTSHVEYYRLRSSYWRWQVSGVRDERALDAARLIPRSDVAWHTYLVREDLDHIGPPPLELLCHELTAVQRELVQVAIPDEESAPCLEGWGIGG